MPRLSFIIYSDGVGGGGGVERHDHISPAFSTFLSLVKVNIKVFELHPPHSISDNGLLITLVLLAFHRLFWSM